MAFCTVGNALQPQYSSERDCEMQIIEDIQARIVSY